MKVSMWNQPMGHPTVWLPLITWSQAGKQAVSFFHLQESLASQWPKLLWLAIFLLHICSLLLGPSVMDGQHPIRHHEPCVRSYPSAHGHFFDVWFSLNPVFAGLQIPEYWYHDYLLLSLGPCRAACKWGQGWWNWSVPCESQGLWSWRLPHTGGEGRCELPCMWMDTDYFPTLQCSSKSICVFLISTYTDGAPPESSAWFCQWLSDAVADFRVQKSMLAGLHFTVFGLGNSVYGENYNIAGKGLFEWLGKLSATVVYPLGLGDQNVPQSTHGGEHCNWTVNVPFFDWSTVEPL